MAAADLARKVAGTAVFRTLAVAGALLGLIATLLALLLLWQTNDVVSRLTLQSIHAEASALARLVSAAPDRAAQAIAEQSRETSDGHYLLLDGDGRRVAGTLNRWPPELPASGTAVFSYERTGDDALRSRRAIGVPVALAGGARLLVARDLEQQRSYLSVVRWLLVAGIATLVLAALLTGILASRAALARIDEMTRTSERIMTGDLADRIPLAGTDDELDRLAIALNAMLDRIGRLMTGLKDVSDNIAHDLKTPLTRLRNGAEAALREEQSGGGYRAALETAIERADELIKTFDSMLLIVRLEAGAVEPSLETFSPTSLMGDVADLYEPLAEESGLKLITVTRGAPMHVRANRRLLGQALANLVDNAIKYGAPEPPVESPADIVISTDIGADGVTVFEVADRGRGIPAADRERALERFARLDASRSRPGTGIGLSLVAAVARLHGGAVTLADNRPGLRVRLSLPKSAVPQPSVRPGVAT
jgi:signal transduction histidine kinase